MFLFLQNLLIISGGIQDSGLYTGFDYSVGNFKCSQHTGYFDQISTKTFANTPQIIMAMEKADISSALNGTQLQFEFRIYDITTTNFKVQIQCLENQIFAVRYRWYAIDDKRIQVINQFNVTNIQDLTFNKLNPNAMVGFISLLNVGFKGPLSFNITISSITVSSVSIQFTDPKSYLGNILQLGYQIILAPPELLNIIDTIWTDSNQLSQSISVIPDSYFLTPTIGYEYQNIDNIRLNTTYKSTNPIIYLRETWDKSYTTNTHQQIQIVFSFTQTLLPLFCNHLEVIQKVDSSSVQSTQVKLLILETNQQIQYSGTYSMYYKSNISTLNFEITVNCQQTQRIQSSFFIFIGQTGLIQQNSYLHNCSSQYRIFTYYPRFKQQIAAAEELLIVLSYNSLTITQINICNQFEISQQQLVAISVI